MAGARSTNPHIGWLDMRLSSLVETDDDPRWDLGPCGNIVGIDTEFMRTRTFYPIPALYQIGGADGVRLIDAQTRQSFEPLRALLTDAARTKVMHASSEDMEMIDRHLGLRPIAVVDTQIAHAFLSAEISRGYAAVVETYLGLALSKQETRSDWLRRPLSDRQLAYAKDDAAHLVPLWSCMRERLVARGRLSWFEDEMSMTLARPEPDPREYYRGMKRAGRLRPANLAVLRTLATWREREARRRDLPRAYVVTDEKLVAVAEAAPVSRDGLLAMLPRGARRRYVDAILSACARGWEEHGRAPLDPLPGPLSKGERAAVKRMRDFVRAASDRLGMAPELLGRRRLIEACVRRFFATGDIPEALLGWRAPLLGDRFLELLRGARG